MVAGHCNRMLSPYKTTSYLIHSWFRNFWFVDWFYRRRIQVCPSAGGMTSVRKHHGLCYLAKSKATNTQACIFSMFLTFLALGCTRSIFDWPRVRCAATQPRIRDCIRHFSVRRRKSPTTPTHHPLGCVQDVVPGNRQPFINLAWAPHVDVVKFLCLHHQIGAIWCCFVYSWWTHLVAHLCCFYKSPISGDLWRQFPIFRRQNTCQFVEGVAWSWSRLPSLSSREQRHDFGHECVDGGKNILRLQACVVLDILFEFRRRLECFFDVLPFKCNSYVESWHSWWVRF